MEMQEIKLLSPLKLCIIMKNSLVMTPHNKNTNRKIIKDQVYGIVAKGIQYFKNKKVRKEFSIKRIIYFVQIKKILSWVNNKCPQQLIKSVPKRSLELLHC